jgi:hypothetical protein
MWTKQVLGGPFPNLPLSEGRSPRAEEARRAGCNAGRLTKPNGLIDTHDTRSAVRTGEPN